MAPVRRNVPHSAKSLSCATYLTPESLGGVQAYRRVCRLLNLPPCDGGYATLMLTDAAGEHVTATIWDVASREALKVTAGMTEALRPEWKHSGRRASRSGLTSEG